MSNSEHDSSAFTSVGRSEHFPPSYEDSKRRQDFSLWRTAIILDRIRRYQTFLDDDSIWKSPRGRAEAELNLTHFVLEYDYRVQNPDWNGGLDID